MIDSFLKMEKWEAFLKTQHKTNLVLKSFQAFRGNCMIDIK